MKLLTPTDVEAVAEAVVRRLSESSWFDDMAREFVRSALKETSFQLELFADKIKHREI